MRKSNALVFALVCLVVVMVALWLKGDVTATVEGLGVRMSIEAKDKRPSPSPASQQLPANQPGAQR